MLVPPDSLTHTPSERVIQQSPAAIVPPLPVVDEDALPWLKVGRKHPPSDAFHSQVEFRTEYLNHVQTV